MANKPTQIYIGNRMHVLKFRDAVVYKVNCITDQWLLSHTDDNASFDIDSNPLDYLDMLTIELDKEFQP